MAKLVSGDRVVYTGWEGGSGEIVKASKVTASWRTDKGKIRRDDLNMLRRETEEDVAKRTRHEAMEAWFARRPDSVVATTLVATTFLSGGYPSGPYPVGVEVSASTPRDMRQAADDLRLLADWFEGRPS